MKALTLWQPWAQLVALGVKTIETRSWRPPTSLIGERIAVHASARRVPTRMAKLPEGVMGDWWVVDDDDNGISLLDHRDGHGTIYDLHDLPLGVIVATCTLVDAVPILAADDGLEVAWQSHVAPTRNDGRLKVWSGPGPYNDITGQPTWNLDDVEAQRPFGDYTPGRWAWLLADIAPLAVPVPAKGRQGLWTWDESA